MTLISFYKPISFLIIPPQAKGNKNKNNKSEKTWKSASNVQKTAVKGHVNATELMMTSPWTSNVTRVPNTTKPTMKSIVSTQNSKMRRTSNVPTPKVKLTNDKFFVLGKRVGYSPFLLGKKVVFGLLLQIILLEVAHENR